MTSVIYQLCFISSGRQQYGKQRDRRTDMETEWKTTVSPLTVNIVGIHNTCTVKFMNIMYHMYCTQHVSDTTAECIIRNSMITVVPM